MAVTGTPAVPTANISDTRQARTAGPQRKRAVSAAEATDHRHHRHGLRTTPLRSRVTTTTTTTRASRHRVTRPKAITATPLRCRQMLRVTAQTFLMGGTMGKGRSTVALGMPRSHLDVTILVAALTLVSTAGQHRKRAVFAAVAAVCKAACLRLLLPTRPTGRS